MATKSMFGLLVVLLLGAGAVQAEEAGHEGSNDEGHESGHESSHEEFHPNIIGLFLGFTGEGRRDNGFAIGIEYERRLTKSFGIGALVERTYGDIDLIVSAIPFAYHNGPWKLYAAPGLESETDLSGTDLMVRLGVEYGFEVGNFEIAPQIDYDIVEGSRDGDSSNAVVIGVTFGYPF